MWGVNELADEAKISAGLAHRVLARLEQEGLVRRVTSEVYTVRQE